MYRHGGWQRPNKRPGPPNGLTSSPVFRTPSFNSSGRSSNCDGDDMYSDVSLEDDVNDLNHKVQVLERQVTVLADNQNNSDDRYTRSRQENAGLQARLIMMEEQLREQEMRAEDQLDQERRRHKELMQRLEREKLLEIENHQIKSMSMEKELRFAESESTRCRQQLSTADAERGQLERQLSEQLQQREQQTADSCRAERLERERREERELERSRQAQAVADLSRELADTRHEAGLRLKTEADSCEASRQRQAELESELAELRQLTRQLREEADELQAQLLASGLQEGQQLLQRPAVAAASLAEELESMSAVELKKSLTEQQEVNKELRTYIDGILLTIVENHPQLLEVKPAA